jgi:putative transcriptional regulator
MISDLTGRLVIASPHLSDGNFYRSVIFMVRHDDEGAFGLLINRPSEKRFRQLVECSPHEDKIRDDDYVYIGGPVPGPLLVLHNVRGIGDPCGNATNTTKFKVEDHPADPYGEMSIQFDPAPIWISSNDDHMKILASRKDTKVRFFIQYSGWGPGQLEAEFRQGGWIEGEADEEIVFGDPNVCWEKAVRQCGHDILGQMSPGMSFGDPNLN